MTTRSSSATGKEVRDALRDVPASLLICLAGMVGSAKFRSCVNISVLAYLGKTGKLSAKHRRQLHLLLVDLVTEITR